MSDFDKAVSEEPGGGLKALDIITIQVNVGLRCNQSCVHCHLNCSPSSTELMAWPTMESVIRAAQDSGVKLIDITGGEPGLNPHFMRFIEAIRKLGLTAQMRTNLSIFFEPGQEHMAKFLHDHQVRVVASMPCYLEENVRSQRGEGTYEKSVRALRLLNSLGYGTQPGLSLDLVYNPGGPALPTSQTDLERDYRRELGNRFGIVFSHLLTITNIPIGRFREVLREQKKEEEYSRLLREAFNPDTVDGLMCRHQVSVAWDGTLYDCDFNIALKDPVDSGIPNDIDDFDASVLLRRQIRTGDHCFACTAGAGSSCGGALT